jgi:flagellar assembly protein FliH
MNSKVIPKEQLTAYQRWELGVLDGADERIPMTADNAEAESDNPVTVALPTAAELERLQQEAWQEGYRLGMEEGRRAGFETGQKEAQAYVQRLKALSEALDAERLRQDEHVAKEILELALVLARQLLRSALQVKPDLILPVVRDALTNLPTLTGHTRIIVHPESAESIRQWLAQEHSHLSWRVVEDTTLAPGGFRIENAHSELDASMETRWREIVDCLGVTTSWLG